MINTGYLVFINSDDCTDWLLYISARFHAPYSWETDVGSRWRQYKSRYNDLLSSCFPFPNWYYNNTYWHNLTQVWLGKVSNTEFVLWWGSGKKKNWNARTRDKQTCSCWLRLGIELTASIVPIGRVTTNRHQARHGSYYYFVYHGAWNHNAIRTIIENKS